MSTESETEFEARFVDRTGVSEPDLDARLWPSVIVPKAAIEAEVDRLAGLPAPADGRRRSLIVHPFATEPGLGLAAGIQVSLEVLLPGEQTRPIRHNSSVISFCIRGRGFSASGGRRMDINRYDVCHLPAYEPYFHGNDGDEVQVRLAYSNAALLEKLNVHFVDEHPPEEPTAMPEGAARTTSAEIAEIVPVEDEEAALLMLYERLISPEVVVQRPLRWPWTKVKAELDKLAALGPAYRGRRLYLLYNPATGRTNGTSNTFFATITIRPPDIVDRPHRHTSAAINYFFAGHGHSQVGGRRYDWQAGDLMLSAPGWAVHNHASGDETVYELTIQDSPLHLAMDSLLWQEDLRHPASLLGSHGGFATNRQEVAPG
jgi:gentisate 1,2-dioxygenase